MDEISNEPTRSRLQSRRRRLAAWASAAVLGSGAVAGGLVYVGSAHASTSSAAGATSTSTASPSHGTKDGRGPGRGGFGRFAGPGTTAGGLGGFGTGVGGTVLHSEATVQTRSGSTEIIDSQTGTISAIDSASTTITVTSADKVAFSYVVGSSTRIVDFASSTPAKATLADLKVGDTVSVSAVRVGDTRTASSVVDGKPKLPSWPKNRPSGAPSPHATASATNQGTSA